MAGQGHSQYIIQQQQQQAAIPGALPGPTYYAIQHPVMYSHEDLQLIQQRLPHAQGQIHVPVTRDGLAPPTALYSVPMADATKYRQEVIPSMPSPMSVTQQQYAAAVAGGSVMTAAGMPAMLPYYMYPATINAGYPSVYPHYANPPLVQLAPHHVAPPQYPPNKIVYGVPSTYYDSLTQEYKTAYFPNPVPQNKVVTSMTNPSSGTDMSGYKSHLNKVNRHPPPFNVPSATSPITPTLIPALPTGVAPTHLGLSQGMKPNSAIKF